MRHTQLIPVFALILALIPITYAAEQEFQEGKIYVWAAREYNSWDNPLHSEFMINGETVSIFSSDTFEPIEQHLKPGWNDIAIKTTPHEPANEGNELIFRIGPMRRDPQNSARFVMSPVLWEFRNGSDWKLKDGYYSHPLGPEVKEVTLNYHIYWAGLDREGVGIKAGDYVLQVKPEYSSWNTPVIATVYVNDTPFNSFILSERQIVITPLLKPGKNEVKMISNRVKNTLQGNDIKCSVGGPAEWYADRNQFMLTPIVSCEAMKGWKKETKSGQLISTGDPNAETIEQTIAFMVKDAPAPAAP